MGVSYGNYVSPTPDPALKGGYFLNLDKIFLYGLVVAVAFGVGVIRSTEICK